MSIEKFIDRQIQQAIARGEFDDLKGKGQPLDLSAYFETPEDLRLAYSMLKGNDFVPEEVELMKEIAGLKRKIEETSDGNQRERLVKLVNEKSLNLSLLLERRKQKR